MLKMAIEFVNNSGGIAKTTSARIHGFITSELFVIYYSIKLSILLESRLFMCYIIAHPCWHMGMARYVKLFCE